MMDHSLCKVSACLGSSSEASDDAGRMGGGASSDSSKELLRSDGLVMVIADAVDHDRGSCKHLAFPCKGRSCKDVVPYDWLSSASSCYYCSSCVL